ncbi:HsdM family class I SAM-dependent methyltransferase [Paractinoplanes toevensis]|uniref:class I SAM-dependent DNA methyltransferase n=1 Tax=Paractinoplanes toevensis TaxID=571911 RepID=UPI001FE26779
MSGAKGIQDILWKAANRLRGTMDAAQYKEFVLGLVFLKYVSDAPGGFRVPAEARWDHLVAHSAGDIGRRLDDAMDAIMRENPALGGVLPKIFARGGVEGATLRELVTLISDARFAGAGQDVLGEVYEYFLEKFARAEGKRAGEFYTPASVVKLLVDVLEPFHGKVYDPCCGSGGMFVQAGRVHGRDIAVFGQEGNERTWRLAKMNLAIHGMDPDGIGDRWADTFADDRHPGLLADFIMANPPFNMSGWARREDDPRWAYGIPPRGNANFAWLQHMVAKLGERGSAGVVLSNGSMSSRLSGEGEIRRRLVEDDLVSCMVALPGNLFRTTAIPACLWFLSRDKGARRGQILFIDARGLGTMVDRTERVLTDADVARIADRYHGWRGTAYADVPGFCFSASLAQVAANDHVLNPGRYVGAASAAEDPGAEPAADRIARLTKELYAQFEESARLAAAVREQLGKLDG